MLCCRQSSQQSRKPPALQLASPQEKPTPQRKTARQQNARQKKIAEKDSEEDEPGGLGEILALGKDAEGRSVRLEWPGLNSHFTVTVISCSQKQQSAVVAYSNGRKETLLAANEPSKYISKLLHKAADS